MAGGAAHQMNRAVLGKVTVMDLLMEVLMMVVRDAEEILSVGAIIVRSLDCTSMRRTTVMTCLPPVQHPWTWSFLQVK